MPKQSRVLFITSTYLGDAIISTTALEWLIQQYPTAQITIACGQIAAPIFAEVPNLERLYVIRKQKWGLHTLKLAWTMLRQRWDFVLDIRGTGIGYLLWSKQHKVWQSTQNIRELRVQQIARLVGLKEPLPCKIYLNETHRTAAEALVPAMQPLALISPLASWDKKCWPADNFLCLAKDLSSENGALPHATIAFLGDPKQRPALQALLQQIPEAQRLDISGNIDLLTLAACMARASLFIGNDSGLMHLAAAMGTPTLGIFGPSRTEVYAPFGPRVQFIKAPMPYDEMMSKAQAGQNIMGMISTDSVHQAAQRLVEPDTHS